MVSFCAVSFSHEVSWMRLSQFLRVVLPTFGVHMHNELLYCGIENQTHCFYSFFYRSILLSYKAKFVLQLSQESPRSHPRHLVGKRTAQKDTIKDIISDSQVNSYFPYRWSPASLTINIYSYLFLYFYITRITINNGTPHLKSLKSQNRRAALGRPAIKFLGASTSLRSTNPRP